MTNQMADTTPHPVARDRALFEAGSCQPMLLDTLTEAAASSFIAYDDVNVSLIPTSATHCSYYGNGPFANGAAMRAHLPHAILSPCLLRTPVADLKQYKYWEHGLSIDVEPSLFTPAQAANIAKEAKAQGIMPRIYFPLSWAATTVSALNAAGLKRSDVQLHSAHWTMVPHVCSGIPTVWGTIGVDQTQYTDRANNLSLDASLCLAGSYGPWGVAPKPQPKPKPQQKHASGQARAEIIVDYDKPIGHRISIHGTHGTWHAGTEQGLELIQVGFWNDGTWKAVGVPRRTKPLG